MASTKASVETEIPLNTSLPYKLSPRVGLRPEPFGAMAYHFDNRRLVFLKTPALVDLVHALAAHPSLQAAVEAAAPDSKKKQNGYLVALASLSEAEVICERETST